MVEVGTIQERVPVLRAGCLGASILAFSSVHGYIKKLSKVFSFMLLAVVNVSDFHHPIMKWGNVFKVFLYCKGS